jgi:hypothetical protein
MVMGDIVDDKFVIMKSYAIYYWSYVLFVFGPVIELKLLLLMFNFNTIISKILAIRDHYWFGKTSSDIFFETSDIALLHENYIKHVHQLYISPLELCVSCPAILDVIVDNNLFSIHPLIYDLSINVAFDNKLLKLASKYNIDIVWLDKVRQVIGHLTDI